MAYGVGNCTGVIDDVGAEDLVARCARGIPEPRRDGRRVDAGDGHVGDQPLELDAQRLTEPPDGRVPADAGAAVKPAATAIMATRSTNQRRMPGMMAQTETCYSSFEVRTPRRRTPPTLSMRMRVSNPGRRVGRREVLVGAQHRLGQLLEQFGRAALDDPGGPGDRQVRRLLQRVARSTGWSRPPEGRGERCGSSGTRRGARRRVRRRRAWTPAPPRRRSPEGCRRG